MEKTDKTKKIKKIVIVVVICLAAAVLALSSFVTVPAGHSGVVLTLGAVQDLSLIHIYLDSADVPKLRDALMAGGTISCRCV